ncbi:MAG: tetraacyldisaccharide 4'-kinase [Candidatus Omnitrophica bacterium]|nr:tetraacyldisaccharide 4'-kinase [Candidatus Omnitrophota bacterium]
MLNFLYNLATDKYKGAPYCLIKFFLFLLSLFYGLIVKALIFFSSFKSYRLDCKVISVGNITLGGTGKTTLVEFIARYLRQEGKIIAILSRGYKRKNSKAPGDEPYMLARNLKDVPVIVDADRFRAGKQALREYMINTLILDDGFQQWKLKKDLEIVAIDSGNPFGNGYLIPRGILREPISSLARADIFVLTKTNFDADINSTKAILTKLNPQALIIESAHIPLGFYSIDNPGELLNVEAFRGKEVTLFAGIAAPDSFENLIISLGIKIGLFFRFPDHYNYCAKNLDKIINHSKERKIDTIITTEKDAARISALGLNTGYGLQILALRIALSITKDEEKFYHRLLKLYQP